MAQYDSTGHKGFVCDEALAQYRRVKMDADGKVTYADATDPMDGTCTRATFAAGELVDVRLKTAAGTHKMVASEAITAGGGVYAAADGKVAADGSLYEGKALEAASGDGSVIEVMPSWLVASGGILNAAQQTLAAGGGAVTVTEYYTAGASDAGGDAWTLADGTFPGQLKKIQLVTDGGGDATLTPSNFTNGSTITFADAGDYAILLWDGNSWTAVELGNDADGATAPAVA